MPPRTKNLNKSYAKLVEQGHIKNNEAQQNLLVMLQAVLDGISKPVKKSLFAKSKSANEYSLYIYGNVGRGKSMLMDLFFEAVPAKITKRRVHFHAFMQEVHARIHKLRQTGKGDPVAVLASEIAQESELLCFDELQATDVADATLLYRLFEGLFSYGICIVSTSNRPPEALYTGGVQAERFEKFIELLKTNMKIAALSSPDDYRYQQGRNTSQFYYYPLDEGTDKFIAHALKNLGANGEPARETITVQGRKLTFNCYNGAIGLFTFKELCGVALGAADYLALAEKLKAFIITDIPKLTPEQRNEAKRFSTLIDTLYENKTKLICTAAVPAEEIYKDGHGAFEFKRTVSRLVEMQSTGYDKKLDDI